ncbi:MAG TPA: sensor histidine kinase [Gemmatimonadaceae bacterium]|nr:sensor histidine kinase [Gemmatimonadaceae bacterium]
MLVPPTERKLVGAAIILLLLVSAATAVPLCAQRPTRVLVLFQQQAEAAPMQEFSDQLHLTIRAELGSPVEFFQEALDLDRFSGREQSSPLTEYFGDKYRGFTIDVVVPVGTRALRFAIDHLNEIFAGVPVVFALSAEPQLSSLELPANVTGRFAVASRFTPTVVMARGLQPDAERIVVIGGAGRADSLSVAAVVSAVAEARELVPLTVLQGMSLDALLPRLRQLPRRSIVIFANYRQDGHGHVFDPFDLVGSIAHASSAPMYTQLHNYIGEGAVGGFVTRLDEEGAQTGRLIVRVLRRRPGEEMPPLEAITNSFVVDWRQLRRWKLPEARLPQGTAVMFRELTPWQRYRTAVLLAIGVIGAELVLIGCLLVERRRRKKAQLLAEAQYQAAEETRRQVAHMGRAALVGELAATMSHELRQPLAAIRANAEAGALIVGSASPDPSEAREIFENIVADDARAVEVIESVRKLLQKDKPVVMTVDLNEICTEAVRLLHHDAVLRKATLNLVLSSTPPTVTGDPVQLRQVVLNLVLNGLEAVSRSEVRRTVAVHTESFTDSVEVRVHDSGPGIVSVIEPHLFESFFSTKEGGLGLGLVIVRSIVERHGGRIRVENHPLGGAVSRVQLPPATPERSRIRSVVRPMLGKTQPSRDASVV